MITHKKIFNLVSWNIRGLGNNIKTGKVFSYLNSLKANIIFLQETHLCKDKEYKLKTNWISQVYHASFTSQARGVAILIHKNVPFTLKSKVIDPNGRFVLISGHIASYPVTLLNIYGPNTDDSNFFHGIFELLPDDKSSHIYIGGDFNCYLDPLLDRTSVKPSAIKNSSKTLKNLMKSRNIIDIWRLKNPDKKEFSFYSPVHNSYTRIDYLLVEAADLLSVQKPEYHPRVISDHSPISLQIKTDISKTKHQWRFNPQLLLSLDFKKYINKIIDDFLALNDNGEVSDSTLWEAFKATMRGYIISYESSKRREQIRKQKDLEREIKRMEEVHVNSLVQSDYNKILKLKNEYNAITQEEICNLLFKNKQKHFEISDKPLKLLSRQLKGEHSTAVIHKIRSKTGEICTDPEDINNVFKDFYTELYTSKSDLSFSQLNDFLNKLSLPQLKREQQHSLDNVISMEELTKALLSFPPNKSPGPDGFGAEFYQAFSEKLTPLLLRMLNHSFHENRLPESLYEAHICVIPKKGKDPLDPASYRPISLLNLDHKILTKILSIRLNKIIIDIIHPDQTGFIPGRPAFGNVRRLLNLLYSDCTEKNKAAILTLDAHKAFDLIEWEYLFNALKYFGFGETFIKWVKIIYLMPKSSIISNNILSKSFQLHRGVRQGDCLSPLLFNIALEPLAIGLRMHPNIEGFTVGQSESLVSLYADDLLLTLAKPEIGIPNLLKYVDAFGKISGYKINWLKSELMFTGANRTIDKCPIKVVEDHITYLGLKISKNYESLLKLNFGEGLEKLKRSIDYWKTLPLSMVGRVNAIKMVSLPKFIYLFQNLPIIIPADLFRKIESIILDFVWGYKKHRISKKHILKSTKEGGLGLPIFKNYYWAANMQALTYWKIGTPNDESLPSAPLWLKIELHSLIRPYTSLSALLFTRTTSPVKSISQSVIVRNSIKMLCQIRRFFNIPSVSLHTPICYNHAFMPAIMDKMFSDWYSKGIKSIKNVCHGGRLLTFEELKIKYSLPQSGSYRYLQLRHFIKNNLTNHENHPVLEILNQDPSSKKLIGKFVKCCSLTMESTNTVKMAWERELKTTIPEQQWKYSLSQIHNCSINSRHRLMQFKVIHRFYYCKASLHKFYPEVSPLCDKCKTAEGSLLHSFWECPIIQPFWSSIFFFFAGVYQRNLVPDRDMVLFGYSTGTQNLPKHMMSAIVLGTVLAKRLLLKEWKTSCAPGFRTWLSELVDVISLEKLRYVKSGNLRKWEETWSPLLKYFDTKT